MSFFQECSAYFLLLWLDTSLCFLLLHLLCEFLELDDERLENNWSLSSLAPKWGIQPKLAGHQSLNSAKVVLWLDCDNFPHFWQLQLVDQFRIITRTTDSYMNICPYKSGYKLNPNTLLLRNLADLCFPVEKKTFSELYKVDFLY